jgi:hypothetical protein
MATGYPAASGRVADPAPGAEAPRVRTAVDSVRGQVKLVETSQAILFGLIVFGLAASLVIYVDAWLLPRQFETSLPDWMRWVSLCSLLGWAIWYGLFRVAPVVFRRIHPEYAARLIEGDRPQYKNSLLNLLSLERERQHVPPEALRYLRAQAEHDIAKAPIEVVVSPRPAFFMACILVGLVAIGAVATALAPDRMVAGATRLAAPWSEVIPPARVEILAVRPGDVEVPLGSAVTVEAEIVRLAAKDAVAVVYSTDDGQFVDVRVPMEKAETPDTWKATLPEVGTDGLRRSLKYRVEAGDAGSATFALKVAPQPTLVAEEVRYEYPAYTRLPARVERLPSTLRALEGTRATLSLSSNVKIGSARLDLYRAWPDFAGSVAPTVGRTVTATASERTASAAFAVAMTADATKSEYAAVVPRMTGETGLVNDPLPIPIEAFRDLPPEVTWRAPLSDKIETPLNRSVELQFQALDPDFGLQKVEWFGLRGESEVFRVPSLDSPQTSPAPRTFRVRFTPDIFGFEQGDHARIAIDAWDGKTTVDGSPAYQRTRSTFIEVTILPPAPGEDPHAEKQPPAGNGEPDGEQGEQGAPGAGESSEGEGGSGGGQGDSGSEGDSDSSGTAGSNSSGNEGQGKNQGDDSQSRGSGDSSGAGQEESEASEGEGESNGSSGGANGEKGEHQNAGGEEAMPSEGGAGEAGSMPSDPTQQPPSEGDPNQTPSEGEANGEGAAGGNASPNAAAQGEKGQGEASGDTSQGSAGQETQGQSSPNGGAPNSGMPNESGTPNGGGSQRSENGQPSQNSEGQPEQGQPNGEGGSQDPLHDGEAFERILEKAQNPSSTGQPQLGQPQQGQPRQGEPQQGPPQGGQPQQGQPQKGQPQGGEPQREQPSESGAQPGSQEGAQPGASGESQDGPPPGSQEGNQAESQGSQAGSQGAQPAPQGGAQPGAQGSGSSDQQSGADSQPKNENPSDESPSQKKESGEGGAKDETTPEQQGEKAPSEGEQGASEKNAGEQADSGKPAGGGKEGEGGAGGSGSKDQNPYASAGGTKKESKEGDGAAPGSKGDAGGTSGGKPNQNGSKSASAGGSMGGSSGPGSMGEGNDAATSGDAGVSPATTELPLPPGEKANLDYSKKATDLVLRYLDDEERRRDPALLKELGWSEAEMESFFAKWKAMKDAADALPDPGETSSSGEFEDAVRALGLRPRTSAQRSGTARDDSSVGDRIDGAVNQPPIEYLEQFRAFQRARNR